MLANVTIGQNGFVTAGLIGGTLILMRQRPIMAGVLLGLLTLSRTGLASPIALIAGRESRARDRNDGGVGDGGRVVARIGTDLAGFCRQHRP